MKIIKIPTTLCMLLLCFVGANVSAEDCSIIEKQSDMNRCYADEYKAVDKTLNNVYASYKATLSEDRKKSLTNAQRAWMKYRDLTCDFEVFNSKGGTIFPTVFSMCLAEKTRYRIEEIKKLSVCEEGDLSC
ncbi:MAG: lysozyme inhibitor LprI family protein [Azoarcus sp.]|jgi:uncharacterized protein YecT (DUF1311 family)|nr:lysozyme inhibitor LprI family protein [Azoarcus sp.]